MGGFSAMEVDVVVGAVAEGPTPAIGGPACLRARFAAGAEAFGPLGRLFGFVCGARLPFDVSEGLTVARGE